MKVGVIGIKYGVPKTLSYLTSHINSVSSIAFTIASEKMKTDAKEELKSLRKSNR